MLLLSRNEGHLFSHYWVVQYENEFSCSSASPGLSRHATSSLIESIFVKIFKKENRGTLFVSILKILWRLRFCTQVKNFGLKVITWETQLNSNSKSLSYKRRTRRNTLWPALHVRVVFKFMLVAFCFPCRFAWLRFKLSYAFSQWRPSWISKKCLVWETTFIFSFLTCRIEMLTGDVTTTVNFAKHVDPPRCQILRHELQIFLL